MRHPPPVDGPPPYRQVAFIGSRERDAALGPGDCRLTFDLPPTSYLFQLGHRILIAIAGGQPLLAILAAHRPAARLP